ncbi:ABC transporter substrate-binding protein [Castellaniella caeni]|uniref:ABC transporter substrate-binding protein n=1 Tax=Castellaniella caeni TaxID=266123 RepID=UPI00082A4B57|nr:ABC transporter substrate-binding protein [Castellaniella caeni]
MHKRLKLSAAILACGLLGSGAAAAADNLTFVSFGGAWGAAQKKHMIDPYEKETGAKILFQNYTGGTAQIKAQVESGNVLWDVVDFETIDLQRACDDGLLETIPRDAIPAGADGVAAKDDFIQGTFNESPCGISEVVWSIVYAYNKDTVGATPPTSIRDVFDTQKIPGKRGLRKKAQINLEWALLADGVPASDVYKVLATKEGQDRAFNKLNSIKKDIVWFDSWSQAPGLLNSGSTVMVQSANGRLSDVIRHENKPFAIVWDGNVHDLEALGIVKGSKNKAAALKFVLFATGTKPLAGMQDVDYGPVRKSSLALVAPDIAENLPSKHVAEGLRADSNFWADFDETLNERFNQWLLQP